MKTRKKKRGFQRNNEKNGNGVKKTRETKNGNRRHPPSGYPEIGKKSTILFPLNGFFIRIGPDCTALVERCVWWRGSAGVGPGGSASVIGGKDLIIMYCTAFLTLTALTVDLPLTVGRWP
jgi:hypothetical protein